MTPSDFRVRLSGVLLSLMQPDVTGCDALSKVVTLVARRRSPGSWFYFGLSLNGIQEVTGSIPVSSTKSGWGASPSAPHRDGREPGWPSSLSAIPGFARVDGGQSHRLWLGPRASFSTAAASVSAPTGLARC